jgi:hypothetical protein
MASSTNAIADECSCEHCRSGGIDVEIEKRSTLSELWIVLDRQMLAPWRTPTYMAVRFWWTLSASLFVSFIFMNITETATGALNLIGAIFNFVNLATIPLTSASVPLIVKWAVYYREVSSGTYRKYVYALAVELAEIPFNLLMAIVSWVIFYWIVGLDPRADKIIYNLLMVLATYWLGNAVVRSALFVSFSKCWHRFCHWDHFTCRIHSDNGLPHFTQEHCFRRGGFGFIGSILFGTRCKV